MIFLTGSTGFLGRHLLRQLIELRPDSEFRLLIRGSSQADAQVKLREALADAYHVESAAAFQGALADEVLKRIEVVHGDLRSESFGLPRAEYLRVASGLSDIFHCAATTNLDLPIETARQVNVEGTKFIAQLALTAAEKGGNAWLHHVSTAFVAGDTDRIVRSDEVYTQAQFRNSYERTKSEAEAVVRGIQHVLPTTIYRPSVIVGDSLTGRTSAFNVLYLPAKLLIKGVCKALPALPHTPFDVVPIDYVAQAIAQLSSRPQAVGQCYHVSAGVGRESSPLEVVETLIGAFERYKQRRPKHLGKNLLVAPELVTRAFLSLSAAASSMRQIEKLVTEHIGVFKQLHPLIPYMLRNPRFDTSLTEEALSGVLEQPPLFSSYADTVFRYCFETNWGRLPYRVENTLTLR
jgi:thioester reductase-like protein